MSAATPADLVIKRVLVIDDDQSVSEIVREYLKFFSTEAVETVADGAEAWELLKRHSYDLVILDWRLPNVTGLILFNRLRALPSYERTPVLVSSGLLGKEDFTLLDEYPATCCLAKPYSERTFKETVVQLLASSHWYAVNQDKISRLIYRLSLKNRQALMELQELLTVTPANTLPLTLLAARAARQRSDHHTAQVLLTTALKKSPDSVPALFELAKVMFESKRYDDAMKLLLKAQKLSPKNLNRTHFMGEVALNQGEPELAGKYFVQVLKSDHGHDGAQRGKDLSFALQKELDKPPLDAQHPMLVGQSLASMINLLAIALVREGKFDEGLARYQEALEFIHDPIDQARLCYNQGLALSRSGRESEARPLYKEADRLAKGTLVKARRALEGAAAPGDEVIELDGGGGDDQARGGGGVGELEPVAAEAASDAMDSTSSGDEAAPEQNGQEVMTELVIESDDQAPSDPPGADPGAAEEAALPPAEGDFKVVVKPPAVAATIAQLKESFDRFGKIEARLRRESVPIAAATILLYHPQDQGWARAEKQLEMLEATAVSGYSEVQPLLDAVRTASKPLVLIWNDGQDPVALTLLEALLETDWPERVGILIHAVGEKPILDVKAQKPQLMLFDKMQIVNWNRARFEEHIASVIEAMKGSDAPLSVLTNLAQKVARLAAGAPLPADLLASWDKAHKGLSGSEVQLWFVVMKSRWLARAGQLDEARALADGARKAAPKLFAAAFAAAVVSAYQGSPTEAVELINNLPSGKPPSYDRFFMVASLLLDLDHLDAARSVMQQAAATTTFSSDYRYLFLVSRILLKEGKAERAVAVCEDALKLCPTRADMLQFYATALLQLKDPRNALVAIGLALQATGADKNRLTLLKAQCFAADGKWREAEVAVGEVLKAAPTDPEALALTAKLAEKLLA